MRLVILPCLLVLLVACGARASTAGGEPEHEHESVHATVGVEGAEAGVASRFATDEVLRRNMGRIRGAVDALSGGADAARTVALSKDVASGVLDIIEHCELPPDADAELHRIIHPLMQGAQAMEADPSDATPLASMRAALDDYARRFDDPSFAAPGDADGLDRGEPRDGDH